MLKKQIVNEYIRILSGLERGYQESLDNLVNMILLYKYNLDTNEYID